MVIENSVMFIKLSLSNCNIGFGEQVKIIMLYLVRVMRKIFCFIICRTGNVSKEIATKRPIRRKARLPKKRLKLAPFVPPPVQIPAKPEQLLSTQDVFEQPTTQVQQKKIELRLPDLPVTNPRDGDSGKLFTIECLALSAYLTYVLSY